MKKCPKCGKTYDDSHNFCVDDGTTLVAMQKITPPGRMVCPVCGAYYDADTKFCVNDGSKLEPDHGEDNAAAGSSEDSAASKKEPDKITPPGRMVCPVCGAYYDMSMKFCVKDGTKLEPDHGQHNANTALGLDAETAAPKQEPKKITPPSRMVCPECGAYYDMNMKFCIKDGAKLEPDQGQPIAAAKSNHTGAGSNQNKRNTPQQKNASQASDKPQQKNASRASYQPQKKSHLPLILGIVIAVVLLCGAGLYFKRDQIPFLASLFGNTESTAEDTEDFGEADTADQTDSAATEATEEAVAVASTEASTAADTEEATTEDATTEETEEVFDEYAAADLVESKENCIAKFIEEQDGKWVFECYKDDESTQSFKTVTVDPATKEITEVEEESQVAALDMDHVEELIDNQVSGANKAVTVIDLSSGVTAETSDGSQKISSSVMIDFPIIYTAMKQINDGTLSLDDEIKYTHEPGGRGVLKSDDVGKTFSMGDMISYMLEYSDNSVTNTLIDYFGKDVINETCQNDGFTSVQLSNYIGSTDENTDNDNYISSDDCARIIYSIYNNDGALGKDFLDSHMMIQDKMAETGLGANIGSDVNFLNFNAFTNNKYNEAAIIQDGDTEYCIVFLANAGSDSLTSLQSAAADVGSYIESTIKEQTGEN